MKKTPKRTMVKVYLTPDIEDKVREIAKQTSEPITAILRRMIRVGLNRPAEDLYAIEEC